MKRKQKNLLIILICLLAVSVYLFMRTKEGFQSPSGAVVLNFGGSIYVYSSNYTVSPRDSTSLHYINMLTNKEVWNSKLGSSFTLLAGIPYAMLYFPPTPKAVDPVLPTSLFYESIDKHIKINGKNSYTSILPDLNLMILDGILIKPTTNITYDAIFQSQLYLAYRGPSSYFYMDVVNSNNPTQALNLFPAPPTGINPNIPRAPQRAPGASYTPILTPNNTYIILITPSGVIYKTTTFPVSSQYTVLYPVTKTPSGQYVDATTYIHPTYTFTPLSEASATALENAYTRYRHAFTSLFTTEQDAKNAVDTFPAPAPAPATPAADAPVTAAATAAVTPPAASAAVAANSPPKKTDNTLLYVGLGLGIPLVLGLITVFRGR